jgi:hypothetical protein
MITRDNTRSGCATRMQACSPRSHSMCRYRGMTTRVLLQDFCTVCCCCSCTAPAECPAQLKPANAVDGALRLAMVRPQHACRKRCCTCFLAVRLGQSVALDLAIRMGTQTSNRSDTGHCLFVLEGKEPRRTGRSRTTYMLIVQAAASRHQHGTHCSLLYSMNPAMAPVALDSPHKPAASLPNLPNPAVLQPIREHLGDIIAWFSAMAPADPTARLVVCQATRSDKAWLQA